MKDGGICAIKQSMQLEKRDNFGSSTGIFEAISGCVIIYGPENPNKRGNMLQTINIPKAARIKT